MLNPRRGGLSGTRHGLGTPGTRLSGAPHAIRTCDLCLGTEPDTSYKSAILEELLGQRPVSRLDRQRARDGSSCGWIMPLLRYFIFVGGALLALLIVVSSYFPNTETITPSDVARPVIRIASDRMGPPRVDIDTRVQTAAVPTSVPEVPQHAPARVAEAQLSARLPTPVAAPIKIERKKTRIAKRPDRQRMAANPQGFQPFHLTW
jgi:hypothetical protein